MPKLSIIVPVYNVEKYLERCVYSIINQSYNDFELILIDDGSTDRSGSICDEYVILDKRIKVIHKKNEGPSSTRNLGIAIANGEYLGFVDSDDWVAPDAFEYLINLIAITNSDVAVGACIETKLQIDFPINKNKCIYRLLKQKEVLLWYLQEGTTGVSGAYSFCRSVYNRRLFKNIEFPIGKINEDIATNYRVLSTAKQVVVSDHVTYFYFLNNSSLSRGKLKTKDFDLIEMCDDLLSLAGESHDRRIIYHAQIKLSRSYFSLLAKIAYWGIDDEITNKQEMVQMLMSGIRKKYFFLILSPMPISRKIALSLLCINVKCLQYPLMLLKYCKIHD